MFLVESGIVDTGDDYEVQEFSEDDLKDIEPSQTPVEDGTILVTPTYPSVEGHTLVKDGKKPCKHPGHHGHGGHEDHWVHEDHDGNWNQEDHGHSWLEDHENPDGHSWYGDHGYPDGHLWYDDNGNSDGHSWYGDHENPEHHEGFYTEEDVPVMHAGEVSGTPGVEFPDYKDIPASSFNCTEYASLPGFYADMETGCQVTIHWLNIDIC